MPAAFPFLKVCDSIIEILLYFLLVFAPLAYGSVELLPLTIVESSIFLIAIVWLLKIYFMPGSLPKVPFWKPCAFFILLAFLQLILLPRGIVSVLSPQRVIFAERFLPPGMGGGAFLCLSVSFYRSLLKLIELSSYGILFYILVNTLETKKQFRRVLMGVILSAILVVILEMSENFKFPFVNKNHFAGYVEMAIPLTMGYFLGITSRPKKIILASVAVIMITALFLAASRAGILCFAASLIFMAFALRLRRASKGKAAFIYALVFIALIFAVVMGIEPVLERFKTIAGELFSRESRLFMWADTLRIIKDFPLLGSGLGTFRDIYPAYRTLTVQEPVFYAHSDFLQLVCETGLLGLGLVLWFLFIFYKEVFSLWLGRHHPFAKGITLGGLTGILAILLHSFFDFGLQIPANALLLTVIIVLVYKSASLDFEDNDSTEKNRNYS